MFKAITKGKAAVADGKGTLTALWGKQQQKEEAGSPAPAPPAADAPQEAATDSTPAGAAKAGFGGQAAAVLTTGGDVAIGTAPEPSPEPAVVAAQAAAAAQPEALKQQQQEVAEPTAAAKANGKASGETGEKKRKRSAAELLSEAQLAKLQAAFAENQYPNTAAKAALAEELGLEAAQVNKWFEKQRKLKREETGEAPKRGRTSGKASGGAKATSVKADGGASVAAAAAAARGATEGPAAAAAAEAAQQEGVVMEVDGEDAAAEPVRQQQATVEQTVQTAEAQPTGTDAVAAEALAATPAPAAPAGPGVTPAADGASPAAGASAGKGAASSKPGKTPASSAPARTVSAEEKAQLVTALEAEAAQLRQQGLAPPLQLLPDAAIAASGAAAPERVAFSDARLAAAVAGQCAPLSQLTAALLPLFKVPDGDAQLDEAVLRSRIVDLAARKSFGPKDGGAAIVDALEDASVDRLWQWELRDQKVLSKELRPVAAAAKRRAARVAERLGAVAAALRLLGGHSGGKAPAKLAKALAALDKTKTLAQIEEEAAAEQAAAVAKEAAKKAAAGGQAGLSAEEKARLKAEKEAAKEAERAAKEAEKAAAAAAKEAERAAKEEEKAAKAAERERAKAEKEAEKEKSKAEKEAEKERKQREAEAAKLVKKAGFKDTEALKKSSAKFMSFFQPKPGGAPGSAVKPGTSQPTPSRAASQQLSPGGAASQQPAASGAEGGAATGKREKGYVELFPKDSTNLVSQPTQPCHAAEMDASAAGPPPSFEQARADWQSLLAGMKARRAAAQPRPLGLPPSWARKTGAEARAAARLQTLLDSGLEPADIRTWRRKFVWFPADSKRPPFYGSCKPSPTVGPRRPFATDEALDYEVMSDLDWEEEPEGSSLSGEDREEESEAAGGDDDAADSFMVSDGYLSEDEGVQLEGLDEDAGDAMDVDVTGPSGAAGSEDAQRLQRLRIQLEVQMKRAVNGGKPLIISRLPAASEPAAGSCIRGDPALLQALAIEVLLPGVRVGLPEDLTAEVPTGAALGAPATGGKQTSPAVGGSAAGGTAGRPSVGRPRERPDDLLPALVRFVQGAARKKKNEIVDEFITAHPTRKVPKAWVQSALKEHAEHLGTSKGWAIKPSGLALLEAAEHAAVPEDAAGAVAAVAAPAAAPTPGAAAAEGGAAAPAAGGVQPTPAAAKPATAVAGIERFFKKDGPMATPSVPSALRPNAPPSELKVPGRLVTTTAAGAEDAAASGADARGTASPGPLTVPASVSGTTDPFWRELLRHIEGADVASQEAAGTAAGCSNSSLQQPRFAVAFQPAALARLLAGMPAGVLTALVAGVAAGGTPAVTRAAYLRCLEAAVHALAAAETEAAGDNHLSASQQVWQPRGAPPAASLAELAREPQLLLGLQACAAAAASAGASVAQVQAGQAAAGVARALLASEAARAAVQAAAADGSSDTFGSGEGLVQQLEAVAAAQQACTLEG